MAKLKFIPCGDDVKEPKPQEALAYTVKINPEQITHSRDVSINENPKNTGGNETVFEGYGNDTINFDLYFDGTGVIEKSGQVDTEITKLKAVIFDLNDSLHKPNLILVMWGGINFYGHCKSFNVNYTLFKSDGTPLRAKVSVSLKEALDPKKKKLRDEQASPDMTHTFTVREGDALPILCKEVYGRMDYYVQVAEFNGLTNFRELEVGSVLNFPPLDR